MIKCDKGEVKLNGNGMMVLSELACIIAVVKESIVDGKIPPDEADDLIDKVVKCGLEHNEKEEKVQENEENPARNDELAETLAKAISLAIIGGLFK